MRRWFLTGVILVVLIFLYLTFETQIVVDDENIQATKDIIQVTVPPNEEINTIMNATEDHNERMDVEFDFMEIVDDKEKNKSVPTPTINLPDHWANPCVNSEEFAFCDESLSFEQRSENFANSLTTEELFHLTNAWSQAINRDNFPHIPFHDWWSEALHGFVSMLSLSFSINQQLFLS